MFLSFYHYLNNNFKKWKFILTPLNRVIYRAWMWKVVSCLLGVTYNLFKSMVFILISFLVFGTWIKIIFELIQIKLAEMIFHLMACLYLITNVLTKCFRANIFLKKPHKKKIMGSINTKYWGSKKTLIQNS